MIFNSRALLLSAVPSILFFGGVGILVVEGWSLEMFLISGFAAIAMPIAGFPAVVFCGKSGLWTWRGRIRWAEVRGIGLARTFSSPSGSFESGQLVPLVVMGEGDTVRWRVLRELRLSGHPRGERRAERWMEILLSHGAARVVVPAKVQPFLL